MEQAYVESGIRPSPKDGRRLFAVVAAGLIVGAAAAWRLVPVSTVLPFEPVLRADQKRPSPAEPMKEKTKGTTARGKSTSPLPNPALTARPSSPASAGAVADPSEVPAPREVVRQAKRRGFGWLTVNARPWARIVLDGKEVASETPLRRLRVSVGEHWLEATNPSGFRKRKKLVVQQKKTTVVFVDVDKNTIQAK